MEAVVARGIQVLIALGGAYAIALWFVLVVWAYRDIETRSRSVVTQVFSTLLVVLFYVPGVLLYLILRPKATLDEAYQHSLEEEYLLQDLEELPLCPSCQRYVEDDFVLCPHCHAKLREACASCGRLVDLRWPICPYCGATQDGEGATEAEPVEVPAARWVSPAVRRRKRARPERQPVEPVAPATVAEPEPAPEVAAESTPESAPTPIAPAAEEPAAASEPVAAVLGNGLVRSFERFRSRGTARARANGSEHSTADLTNSPLFRIRAEPAEATDGQQNGHREAGAGQRTTHRFGTPKSHSNGHNGAASNGTHEPDANGASTSDEATASDERLASVGHER